jgi:ubiquinone/menaquinone biosynthesis C-methylase UbiE
MTATAKPGLEAEPFVRWWKRIRRMPGYNYVLYEAISFLYGESQSWRLMNYGYAPLTGGPALELDPQDEPDRFSLQLYHFVASAGDLEGKDLLEVSSGRGGGASFVHRRFRPKSTTGIDFSRRAIAYCRKTYSLPELTFRLGNSAAIPFGNESFDAVMNVEASHCYTDRKRFFEEVHRVLRGGGTFLYTDVLQDHEYAPVPSLLGEIGFEIRDERPINAEVMRALELDNASRRTLIEREVARPLRKMARHLNATTDSYGYHKLQTGRSRYFRIVAVKRMNCIINESDPCCERPV